MNNISIIVGSHRAESQSLKIGKVVEQKLSSNESCSTVKLLNLAELGLPEWSEQYSDNESALLAETKSILAQSDAYVIVSPEWNGMVPSALKNLFLLYSADVFAHKPALIASVSAGIGGTYPVTELRSTTYKNSRICYIPEHLIFRDVESLFNGSKAVSDAQRYMSQRTDFCLEYLLLYSNAMKNVRNLQPVNPEFANGM